jgi:beta-glucosidase
MSMTSVIRRGGPAVAGVIAIVFGCAPRSVQLEHEPSAGGEGDGAAANMAGAGGTSSGKSGGGASGKTAGGAGRGGAGAGAPFGDAGADSGGEPAMGGTAGNGATQNGGVKNSCESGVLTDVRNGHDLLPGYAQAPDPRVADFLAQMSVTERIVQMKGIDYDSDFPNYGDIMRSPDLTLTNGTVVRGYRYRNGPRGSSLKEGQPDRPSDANDFSTAFPAPSLRGAAWDLDLEWRIGEAIGDETVASMNNLLIGPSVDVIRHPYWGRTQDSYGEDTYHVGRMGTAFTAGVQQRVGACALHFVGNGVEQFRSRADALVDEQSLREIYARPFEMVVRDGGVACVTAAYNMVNGVKAAVNGHLLRDILKAPVSQGGFGFRGFVISDWWAAPGDQMTPDAASGQATATELANAGLDVEMPWTIHYSYLAQAVEAGAVSATAISDAAARVLEQKFRFHSALATDGYGLTPSTSQLSGASIATNAGHLALAEQAALESAVLLANGTSGARVLPIPGGIGSIAVLGAEVSFLLFNATPPTSGDTFHFATDVALGDRGTGALNADPTQSVGPYAGIQAAAALHGGVEVTRGTSAADAGEADLIVVVVGYTPGDEGEEYTVPAGGDRSTLSLSSEQVALVNDALSLGKPTVIVIESGSVVALPWLDHANRNQATIWAGYGGMRAGTALGQLLFGDASFSGKLPLAWAAESALPAFKQAGTNPATSTLDYFVGYREYDRRSTGGDEVDVVFPFGHGLSYTTFGYSNLQVPCSEVTRDTVLDVTADITNTGSVPGDEVAFLFIAGPPGSGEPRSQKELKSFARVSLTPGATERVHLPVRIQDLKHWSNLTSSWIFDLGEYTVLVGSSGADDDLTVAGTFALSPG